VHVSQLSDKFVRDPAEVVKAGDRIKVRVLEVDTVRKRISLTAKSGEAPTQGAHGRPPQGAPQGGRPGQGGPANRGPQRNAPPPPAQPTFSNNPFQKHFRKS
jgi:uncharacterized protein